MLPAACLAEIRFYDTLVSASDFWILLIIVEWESLILIEDKGKGISALVQNGCIRGGKHGLV